MTDNNLDKQMYDVNFLLDRGYDAFALNKSKLKLVQPNFTKKDRKTYVDNFEDVCKSIGREPEDIRVFLKKELQMNSSFMQDGTLKIDAMVKNAGMIESALVTYVKTYVMCKSCNSCKTHTEKVDRLTFLVCTTCKARKALSKD